MNPNPKTTTGAPAAEIGRADGRATRGGAADGGRRSLDILFLTQTYPRFEGDTTGPFIRELARGLVRGGDRVTVLTPHAAGVPERWVDDGVEAVSFRYAPEAAEVVGYSRSLEKDERLRRGPMLMAPAYLVGAAMAVRRALRERRCDLVQAHWVVPNALAAAVAADVPLAVGLHGSDVFLAEKQIVRPWVRRALARTAVLTGCSGELVRRVCDVGFPRRRSHVIPYGVDARRFAPDPAAGAAARERLGIPAEATLVLGVGRMATKKGFHLLPPILDELLGRHPRAHLLLAGGGDRLEELRQATAAHAGRVHLPGAVLHSALPALFAAAELFVMPAVHDDAGNVDGLPNVVLEAMASGLPIVASAVSGIPAAVSPAEGILVPEGDTAALQAALSALLGDAPRRRAMGAAARRRVERELTWDAVAARYRAAYVAGIAHARRGHATT